MPCTPRIFETKKICKTQIKCDMPNVFRQFKGCPDYSYEYNNCYEKKCPRYGSLIYYTGREDCYGGCEVDILEPYNGEGKRFLASYKNADGVQVLKWETINSNITADNISGLCEKVSSCLSQISIGTNQIANNSITTEKIANNSITTEKIANNSITTEKIANGSITSEKIQDGSIRNEDIAFNANISGSKLDFTTGLPTGFCAAVQNCTGGGGGTVNCQTVINCINNATDGSIQGTKINNISASQVVGLCNSITNCLTSISGYTPGAVLTVGSTGIVWNNNSSGGSSETPRQPEFFQNLTSGNSVTLSSVPPSGTILQVFRNGQLWHPQGTAPDNTWSISGATITFSEPFSNSQNGAGAERVAVYFIKH